MLAVLLGPRGVGGEGGAQASGPRRARMRRQGLAALPHEEACGGVRRVAVELLGQLRVVADLQLRRAVHPATARLQVAHAELQEGGLATAILAQEHRAAPATETDIVLDPEGCWPATAAAVAIAKLHAMQREPMVRRAHALGDLEAETQGAPPLHPDEVFLRHRVARQCLQLAVLDPENLATGGVQEFNVVGHDYGGVRVLCQPLLEPPERLEVQVVGRLVKQQQLRLQPECLCQLNLHAPSAGELAHGCREGGLRALDLNTPLWPKAEGDQDVSDLPLRTIPLGELTVDFLQLPVDLSRAPGTLRLLQARKLLLQGRLLRQ
mmetsp:Transcript_92853/g.286655  ORF Transcript_92853/g.286655 Transcript_92853/m.286655 type:complete len:322 (+) Transcript_92853:868-1833(+)